MCTGRAYVIFMVGSSNFILQTSNLWGDGHKFLITNDNKRWNVCEGHEKGDYIAPPPLYPLNKKYFTVLFCRQILKAVLWIRIHLILEDADPLHETCMDPAST